MFVMRVGLIEPPSRYGSDVPQGPTVRARSVIGSALEHLRYRAQLHACPKVPDTESGHRRVGNGTRGSCPPETEECSKLAEVVASSRKREDILAAVDAALDELDLTIVDNEDPDSGLTLLEQNLAGGQCPDLGRHGITGRAGGHFNDPIGQRDHALVVGRDDHDPTGARKRP